MAKTRAKDMVLGHFGGLLAMNIEVSKHGKVAVGMLDEGEVDGAHEHCQMLLKYAAQAFQCAQLMAVRVEIERDNKKRR